MFLSALDAAWRVLAASLLLGAGLPILFALGVRSIASANGDVPDRRPNPAGKLIAGALFVLVVLAILVGIGYIVAHGFGYTLDFSGLLPRFVKK